MVAALRGIDFKTPRSSAPYRRQPNLGVGDQFLCRRRFTGVRRLDYHVRAAAPIRVAETDDDHVRTLRVADERGLRLHREYVCAFRND